MYENVVSASNAYFLHFIFNLYGKSFINGSSNSISLFCMYVVVLVVLVTYNPVFIIIYLSIASVYVIKQKALTFFPINNDEMLYII